MRHFHPDDDQPTLPGQLWRLSNALDRARHDGKRVRTNLYRDEIRPQFNPKPKQFPKKKRTPCYLCGAKGTIKEHRLCEECLLTLHRNGWRNAAFQPV